MHSYRLKTLNIKLNNIFLEFADPPDTIKCRLQVQAGGTKIYANTTDAFYKVGICIYS